MKASLVHDNSGYVIIPESMGSPSPDQMQGTVGEQLGELASRICYDSLGNGRSSVKLHAHILEVINLSVYEHYNFTVQFKIGGACIPYERIGDFYRAVSNRKGVWIEINEYGEVELTTNLRAILEWDRWTRQANQSPLTNKVKETLTAYGHLLAPEIIRNLGNTETNLFNNSSLKRECKLSPDQAWVSLYLYGSRGFTHEQVRHRFAMSQRSTRYVDESESEWIMHPLIKKYLQDTNPSYEESRIWMLGYITEAVKAGQAAYKLVGSCLEKYLLAGGVDKATAKKQARGSSRGYLGNALASEMIFTAPVTGWRWILNQRLSRYADAEIREIYEPVLDALKSSRYGHYFEDYSTIPAPDGMGTVLA